MTAFEVKRLLIAGKQKEALRAAQDGQLWGCALLMAERRVSAAVQKLFCLMVLHDGNKYVLGSSYVTAFQPQPVPASAVDGATQDAVEGMLEEWQENLAIMAAKRTNGDERVIMHLGDCLWRHQDEICGAHICYLVANASFEPFSPSARLCLIGADHCKYPRTYASPETIQPYKLIYALMLAEAGKINEALRYCQAVLKTLKTVGHAADVCKEAAVALEEHLHIHSQAKLGDSNKFRYDKTLKRWVEEKAKAQVPELPLAPPANKLVLRVEENGAPISMSPERPQPTPERPQPVVSGIPPMPPSSNQYAARARQNVRSRYFDTFNKGIVTPSKTSSDSPPLFGVVPKASAKPLAPARFFVPAPAAAAAAPDINSNHSVDPSSAPAFVPDTAFSNGNGPFAAAAFAQPVVQDMRCDPGPMPDHLLSGSSPAMFYSNHYPEAPSTVSLPPPPALEVTPPVMVEQQQQNQHQESSIHRHHHQQSGTVGFEAASSSGVFGDDLQEERTIHATCRVKTGT
ncbi:hypothetical protein SELMODRAFT_415438 [Selaginella moellendorffii]|uniref:Sec16 Sec23-binding domain-containing protein n=1 Tax=Selaginella moellendorffii TaxID=88036 RepID=D8RW45_SELML|nr:hypothetical protein SELMODRAFT_415438 [Selaginella moellendorffii]